MIDRLEDVLSVPLARVTCRIRDIMKDNNLSQAEKSHAIQMLMDRGDAVPVLLALAPFAPTMRER